MKTIRLTINQVSGYNSGDTIVIDVDDSNVPLDSFWRRRLQDSKIDNCVTVTRTKAQKKPADQEAIK